jgi:hypothetical protein
MAATMEIIIVPSASFRALPATARTYTRFTAIHPSQAAGICSIIGRARIPRRAIRVVAMFSQLIGRDKRPGNYLRFPQVPGFSRVSPFGSGRRHAKLSNGSRRAEHPGDH